MKRSVFVFALIVGLAIFSIVGCGSWEVTISVPETTSDGFTFELVSNDDAALSVYLSCNRETGPVSSTNEVSIIVTTASKKVKLDPTGLQADSIYICMVSCFNLRNMDTRTTEFVVKTNP